MSNNVPPLGVFWERGAARIAAAVSRLLVVAAFRMMVGKLIKRDADRRPVVVGERGLLIRLCLLPPLPILEVLALRFDLSMMAWIAGVLKPPLSPDPVLARGLEPDANKRFRSRAV